MKNKIKTLEELADTIKKLRAKGKKVVLCHGVFDLLHVGHIRHLGQAKEQFGDVLVVTLTQDKYVNKGPHRPAFTEGLRAESLASLECVDYVAVNRWPKAVELIKMLAPDFYVKGSEYREMEKDHTGGIFEEKDAIESAGGKLVFTDDITFSATSLINSFMPLFPKHVADYLSNFSKKFSHDEVIEHIKSFSDLKVLVIGEAIIDEYQYCTALGKSSKEPVLAVKKLSMERFAGGVLPVANNISNFSAKTGLVAMLGERNSNEDFIKSKLNRKIDCRFHLRKDSPTIIKQRVVDEYYFTKVFEFYDINDAVLEKDDDNTICAFLSKKVPNYDVVVVTDFGHSMLTENAIKILCEKARFLAVNAQTNAGNLGFHTVSKYPKADYITLTEKELRLEARDPEGDLCLMIEKLSSRRDYKRIMVTRGSDGCLCYDRDEGFCSVPAFARKVVDRVGAGDAFLSISALSSAKGAPVELAGFIGNAVGAQAVATVCNRDPIEKVSLIKHIESLLK